MRVKEELPLCHGEATILKPQMFQNQKLWPCWIGQYIPVIAGEQWHAAMAAATEADRTETIAPPLPSNLNLPKN